MPFVPPFVPTPPPGPAPGPGGVGLYFPRLTILVGTLDNISSNASVEEDIEDMALAMGDPYVPGSWNPQTFTDVSEVGLAPNRTLRRAFGISGIFELESGARYKIDVGVAYYLDETEGVYSLRTGKGSELSDLLTAPPKGAVGESFGPSDADYDDFAGASILVSVDVTAERVVDGWLTHQESRTSLLTNGFQSVLASESCLNYQQD